MGVGPGANQPPRVDVERAVAESNRQRGDFSKRVRNGQDRSARGIDTPRRQREGGRMKHHVAARIGLPLLLLALSPGAAGADPVITWNENAARAATAACLHISGNGLVESRMYAMAHAAIHDAANAIDRRSRPYAY